MANRLSRRLRIVVLATAVATAAVVVPTVASAAPHANPAKPPKPTVASVEKTLAALAKKNTQLVESFNQAQIAVTAAQTTAANAQVVLNTANAAVSKAQVSLSQSALAQYEGGSFSAAGALLSSKSDASYISQLDTMQMISAHSAQIISTFKVAQDAANGAKKKAAALLAKANKTLAAFAAQKKSVQAQVAKYTALLATLTAAQRKTFQNTMNPVATSAARKAALLEIPDITSAQIREAITFAVHQVGKPYSWGSGGPNSYDCSGLTMAAYRSAGISLPHSAADQYNYGHHVSFSDLQPGDLMFFYHPIGHVTMYIGNGLMVSAPQTGESVKIIPADTFGSDYTGATRLISS